MGSAPAGARHHARKSSRPATAIWFSLEPITPETARFEGHALSIRALVAAFTSPLYCFSIATTSSVGWPVIAASVLTSLCLAIARLLFASRVLSYCSPFARLPGTVCPSCFDRRSLRATVRCALVQSVSLEGTRGLACRACVPGARPTLSAPRADPGSHEKISAKN